MSGNDGKKPLPEQPTLKSGQKENQEEEWGKGGEEIQLPGEELSKVTAFEMEQNAMHRCIGALTYFNEEGQLSKGTAFLVAKDIIMTSAHNLCSKYTRKWYTDHKFYPAVNGEPLREYYSFDMKG